MKEAFRPVERQSLSDRLAGQIQALIQAGKYKEGDRLPTIVEMARRFGVGQPTVREALQKLQTMGTVDIRHGSGVYVTRGHDVLVVASPGYSGTMTKKLVVDLVEARLPLEVLSISRATMNATEEDIEVMRGLIREAEENLDNDERLNVVNMTFHRQIALASGNTVLSQMLEVVYDLFSDEFYLVLGIFGCRERDHREHVELFEALEQRDEPLATRRMREHLEGVREAVLRWDPSNGPVA